MSTPPILNSEAIRKADDLPIELVDLRPYWPGAVYVRTLAGHERDAWENMQRQNGKSLENIRARFAALVAVDANRQPIFSELDAGWLGNKSAAALDKIMDAAFLLNRMGGQELEEAAKNSESGPSDDSGSDSPENSAAA